MYVYVDPPLAVQLTETESFLKDFGACKSSMDINDAKQFRPTVEALDKLAVAVHVATQPVGSFLASQDEARARFDASNKGLATVLEATVAYLRNPEVAAIAPNSLSIYNFEVTKEPLDLLKNLFHAVVNGVRTAAEQDVRELRSGDVGTFLAAAEVIRTWTVNGA